MLGPRVCRLQILLDQDFEYEFFSGFRRNRCQMILLVQKQQKTKKDNDFKEKVVLIPGYSTFFDDA